MCEKDGGDLAGESLFLEDYLDFMKELNHAYDNKLTSVDDYVERTYWIGISTSVKEKVCILREQFIKLLGGMSYATISLSLIVSFLMMSCDLFS